MIDLLDLHKMFILRHLHEGDTAVDFTMGNGHDTEFLSKTVGENGHVFAFDIQEQAVESTRANLAKAGCPENYTLILDSHHNVEKYVREPITTMRETTMPAIKSALGLLGADAVLMIAVYPGHAEGDAEGKMIDEYLSTLNRHVYCAAKVQIVNSPTSPYFFMIETK